MNMFHCYVWLLEGAWWTFMQLRKVSTSKTRIQFSECPQATLTKLSDRIGVSCQLAASTIMFFWHQSLQSTGATHWRRCQYSVLTKKATIHCLKINIWLVVWNMSFLTAHILGIVIPTDLLIFFRGVGQPPARHWLYRDGGGCWRFMFLRQWSWCSH